MKLRLATLFSHEAWEQDLMSILTVYGSEGWELKSILYEFGFHYHLIFARPVPAGEPITWRPSRCRCGYDLTGNTSGVCPECGAAVPTFEAKDRTTPPRPPESS